MYYYYLLLCFIAAKGSGSLELRQSSKKKKKKIEKIKNTAPNKSSTFSNHEKLKFQLTF